MRAGLKKRLDVRGMLRDRRVFLAILILLVGAVMSVLSPYFLRINNLLDMTQFGAVIGLLALGQTLVILGGGGGIDLSVGSSLSLSGVLMGLLVGTGMNVWGAVCLTLLIGLGLGAFNGFFINWVGLPPFITTLGTLFAYSSLALVLAGGTQITGFDEAGFKYLGQAAVFGVPTQVLYVLLPAYLIVGLVMAYTKFGRNVYEVGNNDRAAKLIGVSPKRVRFTLYCVSGLLAGLAAVVTNSWLLVARPGAGVGLELQSITIAVLGGTYIFGGQGRVSGTLLAIALVVVLTSGLQLAGVEDAWQGGILGVVLIASVIINNLFMSRSGEE